jgi:hypothetical protein
VTIGRPNRGLLTGQLDNSENAEFAEETADCRETGTASRWLERDLEGAFLDEQRPYWSVAIQVMVSRARNEDRCGVSLRGSQTFGVFAMAASSDSTCWRNKCCSYEMRNAGERRD